MTRSNCIWQSYCLKLAGISTCLTAVLVMIVPQAGNRAIADFEFPREIELNSQTTIKSSNSLDSTKPVRSKLERSTTPETKKSGIIASHQYQYTQEPQPIKLEINYIVNTRGDVETYLQNYTSIAPEIIETKQIEQIEGVGDHALLVTPERVYLTSCISPRSLSNITQRQFSKYRYQNDLQWQVIKHWLQGKASIRDRRCLWVNLSTPLTADTQAAYQSLETAWQEVYQWWLPNFPPLSERYSAFSRRSLRSLPSAVSN